MRFNNEDTYVPDMVICRPEIADDVLAACAKYYEEHGSFEGVAQ